MRKKELHWEAVPTMGTNLPKRADHHTRAEVLRLSFASLVFALAIAGCTSIWNAGDLAVWVREQAVEEGCRRDTIVLDEWYTETTEGNIWRGTCRDADDNPMTFGIDVDPVWTPSQ